MKNLPKCENDTLASFLLRKMGNTHTKKRIERLEMQIRDLKDESAITNYCKSHPTSRTVVKLRRAKARRRRLANVKHNEEEIWKLEDTIDRLKERIVETIQNMREKKRNRD